MFITHSETVYLPNGKAFSVTSTKTGGSKRISLPFGFYRFVWWGECDPETDGYYKVFGNIYRKEKRQ